MKINNEQSGLFHNYGSSAVVMIGLSVVTISFFWILNRERSSSDKDDFPSLNKKSHKKGTISSSSSNNDSSCIESDEIRKLRRLFALGKLKHPYRRAEYYNRGPTSQRTNESGQAPNFVHLSQALSMLVCGKEVECDNDGIIMNEYDSEAHQLLSKIIRDVGMERKHILFILCDGLGSHVLHNLKSRRPSFKSSCLCRYNDTVFDLRAVW